MPAFEDFLNAFSHNPETFNEEQFKAAITAAHDEDVTALTGQITSRDADIKARDEKITKLGADNWNLLMKQGPKIEPKQNDQADTSTSSGDGDSPKTIDSFFKKVER